ncbi:MAG: phosphohistidine phosphatase SixA [Chloroflexi bacterium]|nr:phosphohistidine phosphatase SixA [Chloroflexota bacterium]
MKLYLMRHGIADWPDWDRPDDERPLNTKGRRQMEAVAAALVARGIQPGAVLTSPLPRAQQTAEIVASAFGLTASVEPALAPGFDATQLPQLLERHTGADLMIVGHEPDLSEAVAALTGGVVAMKKAAVACVGLTSDRPPRGALLWLAPPKVLL